MKLGVAGVFALSLSACPGEPVYPPPAPIPVNGDECEAAQKRLEVLVAAGDRFCIRPDGSPRSHSPAGRPFAVDCREAMADGRERRPDCIAQIPSCSKLEEAYRTPRGTPCPTW